MRHWREPSNLLTVLNLQLEHMSTLLLQHHRVSFYTARPFFFRGNKFFDFFGDGMDGV